MEYGRGVVEGKEVEGVPGKVYERWGEEVVECLVGYLSVRGERRRGRDLKERD